MASPTDIFQQLQQAIQGYLSALPFFQYTPVFLMRPRVDENGMEVTAPAIQSEIDNALMGINQKSGKGGTAVMILMPHLNAWDHKLRSPQDMITVAIRVVENVLINASVEGSGVSCEALAKKIRDELHFWVPGRGLKLMAQEGQTMLALDTSEDNEVSYEVYFFSYISTAEPQRPFAPLIGVDGSTITLSCNTGGVSIYYTLDGTAPFPNNANAVLYSAPFTVSSGQDLKACALLTGLSPSHTSEQLF